MTSKCAAGWPPGLCPNPAAEARSGSAHSSRWKSRELSRAMLRQTIQTPRFIYKAKAGKNPALHYTTGRGGRATLGDAPKPPGFVNGEYWGDPAPLCSGEGR